MREYLYIPLGGNRVGPARALANLWIVFLVSGLWHGAAWTFVVWGAYQGVFLTFERLGGQRVQARLPLAVRRLLMVLLVTISWVIFRSETLPQAWELLRRMFVGGGPHWYETVLAATVPLDRQSQVLLLVAALGSFLPWSRRYLDAEQRVLAWRHGAVGLPVSMVATAAVFALACMAVVNSSHNPFIYFRF
jgi:alginate O-acetyltransferase complex protein AlgI